MHLFLDLILIAQHTNKWYQRLDCEGSEVFFFHSQSPGLEREKGLKFSITHITLSLLIFLWSSTAYKIE